MHAYSGREMNNPSLIQRKPCQCKNLRWTRFKQRPASLTEWTAFHEAVQRLPDDERDVFDLHWYQGLDQKVVAGILGVTDRTVKNRWRNAKLRLRQMLAEEND
jgi:DNA-directed RNA polymerase specialized sigma24 family protein